MTARLAMLADSVGSVRRESRVWVKKLIGEGHATVRRNRRAVEEELMVEPLRGACVCAEKGPAAMKRVTCLLGVIIAAYLMTTPAVADAAQGGRALDAPAAVKARIAEGYGKLPFTSRPGARGTPRAGFHGFFTIRPTVLSTRDAYNVT